MFWNFGILVTKFGFMNLGIAGFMDSKEFIIDFNILAFCGVSDVLENSEYDIMTFYIKEIIMNVCKYCFNLYMVKYNVCLTLAAVSMELQQIYGLFVLTLMLLSES